MYTNATLVARPTTPAAKKYVQVGRPPVPVCPFVLIITLVTTASPTTDRIVVTQYPRLSMFIGSSVSFPRTKKIATIVARRPNARTTSGKKIHASGFGQQAFAAMV